MCTGSLLLAAAGLLKGRRATSHWLALDELRRFGAEPTGERVVIDGKYVTAAGVSSGIDMGLDPARPDRRATTVPSRPAAAPSTTRSRPTTRAPRTRRRPARCVERAFRYERAGFILRQARRQPAGQVKRGCPALQERGDALRGVAAAARLPGPVRVPVACGPFANSFAAACVSCERRRQTIRVNSATRLPSSPSGSTSSTRPVRSARSASINSPENSRYLAAAGPTSDTSRRVEDAG